MLAFLQGISCPFGRCICKTENVSSSPRRKKTGKHFARHYGEVEGNVIIPRIDVSSPTLPELTDCGTLTAHLCGNEHLYWNSTLLERENDASKGFMDESENDRSSKNHGPMNITTFDASRKDKDVELQFFRDASDHKFSSTPQQDGFSKQLPMGLHNDQEREGRRVTDISLKDNSHKSLFDSPRPPRIMATNTQKRKELIPLPPKRVPHLKKYPSGGKLNASSIHVDEDAITATAPENQSSSPSKPLLPQSSPSSAPLVNGISQESRLNGEVLTWDFALQKILSNDCVDDATKKEIGERMQTSQSINGSQNEGHPLSVMGASGLVPNFSHPIAGSRFSDREPHRVLTNGVEKTGEKPDEQFTNGISPEQHFDFASEASSHHKQCCITHSADRVSDRINYLLSEELTPSELSLHDEVVVTVSSNYPTGSPASASSSETQLIVPRGGRLIYKLHRIIHGLQDRVNGLEDILVPQLSTALEQKSYAINELRFQLASLEEIVNTSSRFLNRCYRREKELLHTLDELRAKKIYKGSRNSGGFKKWMKRSKYVLTVGSNEAESSKEHGKPTRDANLNHPTDHVFRESQQITSKNMGEQQSCSTLQTCSTDGLPKKDLSIVVDMALQNVQMLAEDMGQISTLITDWANLVEPKDEVAPISGSWRDI